MWSELIGYKYHGLGVPVESRRTQPDNGKPARKTKTVVLWPLDEKLLVTVNGEDFISPPFFVWGRLWGLFCTFGEDLLTKKQREYGTVPDVVIDENQQVSAQHVQEILRRIDESIAAGTFERIAAPAWEYSESERGLGAAAKSDWARFLEFARTLGINGFSIQG
jgi:hypothetical protein